MENVENFEYRFSSLKIGTQDYEGSIKNNMSADFLRSEIFIDSKMNPIMDNLSDKLASLINSSTELDSAKLYILIDHSANDINYSVKSINDIIPRFKLLTDVLTKISVKLDINDELIKFWLSTLVSVIYQYKPRSLSANKTKFIKTTSINFFKQKNVSGKIMNILETSPNDDNAFLIAASFILRIIDAATYLKCSLKGYVDFLIKKCVDDTILQNKMLPAITKALLRSAETNISAVEYIISQLDVDFDNYSTELSQLLVKHMCSSSSNVRIVTIRILSQIASKCKEPDSIIKITRLVYDQSTGPESRRLGKEATLGGLDCIGQLSNHGVTRSVSAVERVATSAVNLLCDFITSELHEETVIFASKQLTRWLRQFKTNPPERFTNLVKTKAFNGKTDPAVRRILLTCLADAFDKVNLAAKQPLTPFLPQLVGTMQRAVKHAPHSLPIHEALPAALVWLRHTLVMESQSGQLIDKLQSTPLWTLLTGSTASSDKRPWFTRRFLQSAPDYLLRCLVKLIECCLTHLLDHLPEDSLQSIHRTLTLLASHPNYSTVRQLALESIRSIITNRPNYSRSLRISLLNHLVQCCLAWTTTSSDVDSLCSDLDRLWSTEESGSSVCCPARVNQLIVCLATKTAVPSTVDRSKKRNYSDMSTDERITELDVLVESVFPCSHPLIVEQDPSLWIRLQRRLGLLILLPSTFAGEKEINFLSQKWTNLVDRFVNLPLLDDTYSTALRRLFAWSPTGFGKQLLLRLHSQLSSDRFTRVTASDVSIMLTPPNKLFNKEVLVGLPEYQSTLAAIGGGNTGDLQSPAYSYQAYIDRRDAWTNLQNNVMASSNNQSESILDQMAKHQLSTKQLDLIRQELTKEAEIRDRLDKLEVEAAHLNNLLTHSFTSLQSMVAREGSGDDQLQRLFLIDLDLCNGLSRLLANQMTNPLLAPHSIGPYVGAMRCITPHASHYRHHEPTRTCIEIPVWWSLRLLEPARVMVKSQSQAAHDWCRQLTRGWSESVSLDKQTGQALQLLTDQFKSHPLRAAMLVNFLFPALQSTLLASGWARPLFYESLPLASPFTSLPDSNSLLTQQHRIPASLQARWSWLTNDHVKSLLVLWKEQMDIVITSDKSPSDQHLYTIVSFPDFFKLLRQLIDGCLSAPPIDSQLTESGVDTDDLFQDDGQVVSDLTCESREGGPGLTPILLTLAETIARLVSSNDNHRQLSPLIESLVCGLTASTQYARQAVCRCLLILVEQQPDLVMTTLQAIVGKHVVVDDTNPITIDPVDHCDGDDNKHDSEQDSKPADDDKPKVKFSKQQRRKFKKDQLKAAAAAGSGGADSGSYSTGNTSATYNSITGYASPACWPALSVPCHLQLRLKIGRCDTDSEVALLCDRIWRLLGFNDNEDSSSSNLLNSTQLVKRLLLETTRPYPSDLQQATANALAATLQSAVVDQPQLASKQLIACLAELVHLYRVYHHREPPVIDSIGRVVTPESPDRWRERVGLGLALNRINEIYTAEPINNRLLLPGLNNAEANGDAAADSTSDSLQCSTPNPLAEQWLLALFRFLIPEGLSDRHAKMRSEMLQAGLRACSLYGKVYNGKLFPLVESFLAKAPNKAELDQLRQSLLILTANLSRHLEPDNPKVVNVFNRLIGTLNFPSAVVQQAVEDCIASLVGKLSEEQVAKTVNRLTSQLLESGVYAERHGAAHGLAGVARGLGIMSLKQYQVIDKLGPALDDSKSAKRREGALMAVQRLCIGMDRLFEPYVVRLINSLLNCFGDSNTHVRETASNTARTVMSQLSAHGVKLILPTLLRNIDEQQSWRTRAESVNLLATMTNCAPKQLSACLPQIVPRLLEVLVDSQDRVKEAGAKALSQIAGVIRNPEVQALVPSLTKCLQDPLADKMQCLLALRDTCFVHALDAPSLALILPVIQRSFAERSTEVRKTAAQIFGNLHSLARREDLQPYVSTLLPPLKTSLLDAVPEVRSVAAAALGGLVRGIGESMFKDILPWLMSMMTSETSSVDRSGAAQGLAEVLGGMGIDRLRTILPELIHTASSESNLKPCARDGYLMLFIYLPAVFHNSFAEFLGPIIPTILRSLSDETEYIRETALRAAQRIIQLFAESAVDILLPELEQGLGDTNWRIRLSSVQLLGDLLYQLSGLSGKGGTKTRDEDDTFGTQMAYKQLQSGLGSSVRHDRVLARLHMARVDPTLSVRQAAVHVWKIVVPNTSRTLREIMPTLMQLLLDNLGSASREQQQLAARSLGDVVRKLGDRVVPELLPLLVAGLDSLDSDHRRGVCIGLVEIIRNCPKEQLSNYTDNLVGPTRRALCDEASEVRRAGARTFDLLHARMGVRCLDGILPDMMAHLTSDDKAKQQLALEGLRQLLVVKAKVVMPYLVPQLIHPKVNVQAFAYLASVSGDSLGRHLNRILPALLNTVVQLSGSPEDCEVLVQCATILSYIYDMSSVRLIVNELLLGVASSSSSSTSTVTNSPAHTAAAAVTRNSEQSDQDGGRVVANLRLLNAYLDVTFDDESAGEATAAAIPSSFEVSRRQPQADDSDESDDEESSDEDFDDDEESDESSSEEEEEYGSDDDEMPDPKASVSRVLREFSPLALRNICRLLASRNNKVLRCTWDCLESLVKRWTPDTVTTQIADLRQGIRGAVSELNKSTATIANQSRSPQTLPGLSSPDLPLVCLVRLCSDCILRSSSTDTRESASQVLAELIAHSSGPALQRCVVKIIGPLIRLLSERQTNVIRLAVLDSLNALVNKVVIKKTFVTTGLAPFSLSLLPVIDRHLTPFSFPRQCPSSSRPFVTQLQTTFSKCLADQQRDVRLLGGKGLASITTLTPKLDLLLTDLAKVAVNSPLLASAINNPSDVMVTGDGGPTSMSLALAGLSSYPETSLNALHLCLIASQANSSGGNAPTRGGPSLAALTSVLSSLRPLLCLGEQQLDPVGLQDAGDDDGETSSDSSDAIRAIAAKAFGATLACLQTASSDQSTKVLDEQVLSPSPHNSTYDQWTFHQSQCLVLLELIELSPSTIIVSNDKSSPTSLYHKAVQLLTRLASSPRLIVCHLALCCLTSIIACLASSSSDNQSAYDTSPLIQCLTKALSHDSIKLRIQIATLMTSFVGWRVNADQLSPSFLNSWLQLLLTACRDKASAVRLGGETGLVLLCRIGLSSSVADQLGLKPTPSSANTQRCLSALASDPSGQTQLDSLLQRLRKQNWIDLWRSGSPDNVVDATAFSSSGDGYS